MSLLLAVGCNSTPEAPKVSADQQTPAVTSTTGGSEAVPNEQKAPTLDDVASELKGPAFEYYGLGNNVPMAMEAVYSTSGMKLAGTQTITLIRIDDGKPVFEISRTGDLSRLGTQEVTLEKDGLYVTKMDVGTANHDLELPNDLVTGKSWNNAMKVDQKLDIKSTFKVVGPVKVKTPVAERDAILITSTGSGTLDGKKVTMDSQNWYVKGIGGVKTEITTKFSDGKKETITVQEVKSAPVEAPVPVKEKN